MKKSGYLMFAVGLAVALLAPARVTWSQKSVANAGVTQSGVADAPAPMVNSVNLSGSSSNSYLPLTGGAMNGPLNLSADPQNDLQAATKHYVDTVVSTAVPLAGGVVSGTLGVGNEVAKLPRVDVRSVDFAGGADPSGVADSTAAIQAAVAFALAHGSSSNEATYPTIYLPPGHYKLSGTIRLPENMHLVGDSKANTILQETSPTANLITVYDPHFCSSYVCYGGIENLTLMGSGKATRGTLLEMEVGLFTLRDVHFFNNAGRGLQMNGASERLVGYDLSFYDIRWPMVMGGDTNEDYFYNTHIVEAGQTKDPSGSPTWFNNWCYSVNCTNGVFHAPGTSANPTILYPDPHGSIHIDKAVNVSFIGGSIKDTGLLSGVRIWNGDILKFENLYHEDSYGGNIPRTNRAYILGGKAEQTYLTGTLSSTGFSAPVADPSWMPQYFGDVQDLGAASNDYYPYVILPQDYNRASSAPSAYVSGLQQNQYEIISIQGFASDGAVHIQSGGRNSGGSTAPAGTQWPAGSVIEQFSGYYGFGGPVEFSNIHLNQVQGPVAVGGYQVGCTQTNVWACGEIVAGFAPDVQALTSNPATNQVGLYAPLGDPNDPVPAANVSMNLRSMDMGNNGGNPYVGQIATSHRVTMQIYGGISPEAMESQAAVNGNGTAKQISIAAVTGGSYVTAPIYSTGWPAAVQVTMPDAGTFWDSSRNYFTKKVSTFGVYQQYGAYMNGLQYQNLYCLFDTPTVDGGHVGNRFCTGGGPSNTGVNNGPGYGGGIEYDSWNGSSWASIFKVSGNNGAGTVTTGALTSISVTTGGTVTGSKVSFGAGGSSMSNAPVMVWSPWGECSTQNSGCSESGAAVNLIYPVTVRAWTMTLDYPPTGCTNAGTVVLYDGGAAIATVNLANGISSYAASIASPQVAANSALNIKVATAATGCTVFGTGMSNNITYSMQ